MKKRALLAALLAMTLLLSSCALIVKDAEVDAKTVILKLGDNEVTKKEVQELQDSILYYYQYLYGADPTDEQVLASAQTEAITELKKDMIIRAKAAELGLDQLTDEEKAKAEEDTQSDLDYAKESIKSSAFSDTELEGEELDKAIEEEMEKRGITHETYLKNNTDEIVDDKVREYIIKDVAVSDDEVKAEYDSKVAADEEKYKDSAASWTTTANNSPSTTLYYTPAGIRRVKQILIKFKEEDQTAIDEANTAVTDANTAVTTATSKVSDADAILENAESTEEAKTQAQADKEAAQAELEAAQKSLEDAQKALDEVTEKAFANIDADADAVLEELNNGGDWDTLQAEKNEDPGMKSGVTAEKGYAVSADMTSFDSAFVEAAMALQNIGDVSAKVKGKSYGYYIIRYVADETEGAVDYDSVKEAIHDDLLDKAQDAHYTETIQKWIDEAGIKEDLNALKD